MLQPPLAQYNKVFAQNMTLDTRQCAIWRLNCGRAFIKPETKSAWITSSQVKHDVIPQ